MRLVVDHTYTKAQNGIDGHMRQYETTEAELDKANARCARLGMEHDGGYGNLNGFWKRWRCPSGTIQIEGVHRLLRDDTLIERYTVSFCRWGKA